MRILLSRKGRRRWRLGVRIHTHTLASTIDRRDRRIHCRCLKQDEEFVLDYDRLVLATGSIPRVAELPGIPSGNLLVINNLEDYRRLRAVLKPEAKVAIFGGGFIGCEFANDLAAAGYQVHLVEKSGWLLRRFLPEAVGYALGDALRTLGVRLFLEDSVATTERQTSGWLVKLASGQGFQADCLISAVGYQPNVDLAKECDLLVDQGIVVDKRLCTSDPSLYALGDCAQTPSGVHPFIMPLMAEAKTLAAILAGQNQQLQFDAMPITVKTSVFPIVTIPPVDRPGEWLVDSDSDLKAGHSTSRYLNNGALYGFVLTGNHIKKRTEMVQLINKY